MDRRITRRRGVGAEAAGTETSRLAGGHSFDGTHVCQALPLHTHTHGIVPCPDWDPLSITYNPEPLQDRAEAVLCATCLFPGVASSLFRLLLLFLQPPWGRLTNPHLRGCSWAAQPKHLLRFSHSPLLDPTPRFSLFTVCPLHRP